MKKGLIFLTCVVVIIVGAYLAHIAYVGNALQKGFENFVSNNEFLELKESKFNKGFFGSNANLSFSVKNENSFTKLFGNKDFNASVEFINNFFASESVRIRLFNPDSPSEELLNIALSKKSFEKNIHFVAFLGENLHFKRGQIQNQDYKISGILDENSNIIKLNYSGEVSIDVDNVIISFIGSNDEIIFGKDVSLSDLVKGFYPATIRSHYDELIINTIESEIVLKGVDANSTSSLSENKEFFKGEIDIKIAKIFNDNIFSLNDINASFAFDNVSIASLEKAFDDERIMSDDEFKAWLDDFSLNNPKFDIKNLSFVLGNNIIATKGFAGLFAGGSELKFELQTSQNLGESFPILNIFGINRYFVQKDGNFVSDIHFLMKDNQMSLKINGEEELPTPKYNAEPEPSLVPNAEPSLPFFDPNTIIKPESGFVPDLNTSIAPELNGTSEEGIEKFLRQEGLPQSATLEK